MNKPAFQLIRLDGSHQLGLGHVYRMRELATKLRQQEINSLFLVNDNPKVINLLNSFDISVLRRDYTYEEEKRKINSLLSRYNIKIIISDLLEYSNVYIKFLKTLNIPKVTFHEHATNDDFSDLLVNYNTFEGSLSNLNLNNSKCLGPKFCILPSSITPNTNSIKKKVDNILITFGGSDPCNFSSRVVKILDAHKNALIGISKITLHLGIENKEKEYIEGLISESSLHFEILSNVKDFSSVMRANDMAICSGGNTMYELCYLGIPSIVVPQNSHQRTFALELDSNKILKLVDINDDFDNVFIKSFKKLLNDYEARKEYNAKSLKIFDGKGIDRLSKRIVNLQK